MNEAEIYQRRPFTGSGSGGVGVTMVSDSTIVATSANQYASEDQHHGRVVRPARRKSRASRRAPTTLLNTDTTNFRSMVQQFTGIPSVPTYPTAAGNFHSSLVQQPTPPPAINFGTYQHASLLQQQQQQQQFQLHNSVQPYDKLFQQQQQNEEQQQSFTLGGGTTTAAGVNINANDVFLQGFLGNPNSATHDGYFMDAAGASSTRPGPSTDHRSDSYFL